MKRKKQLGFSLLELFIALAIGLALLLGVLSVFVGMRTTTAETSSYGEMQENGRFAISILTDDLLKQDFWGDLSVPMDLAVLETAVPAIGSDCNGAGVNNATFPVIVGSFRTLWGDTVTAANAIDCISDAKVGSDLLQVKRVIAAPIATPDPIAAVGNANRFYLIANSNSGEFFLGNTTPTAIENSQIWQYQHHIYYIREETQGSNVVPVLMQGQLTNAGMDFDVLVDGIEMIRFMYGVDTDVDADTNDYLTGDGDGIVDAFISADNMTPALWSNNNSRILAVKMYVLVRDIMPDNKYSNTNTYVLGDRPFTFNDNYRRLLFTSTVTLYNARVDTWN